MRIYLLLTIIFLASCSPPKKVYTKPEIGIEFVTDFQKLCGFSFDDIHTLTNEKGETLTVTYKSTDYKGDARPDGCVGIFTFVNNKLISIEY